MATSLSNLLLKNNGSATSYKQFQFLHFPLSKYTHVNPSYFILPRVKLDNCSCVGSGTEQHQLILSPSFSFPYGILQSGYKLLATCIYFIPPLSVCFIIRHSNINVTQSSPRFRKVVSETSFNFFFQASITYNRKIKHRTHIFPRPGLTDSQRKYYSKGQTIQSSVR